MPPPGGVLWLVTFPGAITASRPSRGLGSGVVRPRPGGWDRLHQRVTAPWSRYHLEFLASGGRLHPAAVASVRT